MIPSKIILPVLLIGASLFASYLGLQNSEKNGTIKEQEKTISLLKSNVDCLQKALEDKPTNANTINIDIDKLKAKKNGQIILDATQLQALSCDTVGIVNHYFSKLNQKQRNKLLKK